MLAEPVRTAIRYVIACYALSWGAGALVRAGEASPGEAYSAEYLGLVPAGGCMADADCASILGSIDSTDAAAGKGWTCFAGYDAVGQCSVPSSVESGTCVCSRRAATCPNG